MPTYKTGQRIPVEAAGWLKSQAGWVEILFLFPTCATPDPLHRLFEPQFCPFLNGSHEDAHVRVLCLHLYMFRRPVNGSASKQKAGFPWPTKTESCTFGAWPDLCLTPPPLAQRHILKRIFFFNLRPQSQGRSPWEGSEGSWGSALAPPSLVVGMHRLQSTLFLGVRKQTPHSLVASSTLPF